MPYREALALQHALHARRGPSYLLVLEHPHVVTLGVRADPAHILVDVEAAGAELVRADRGGDVTYHGPGQLVAYPIMDVAMAPRAIPDHVHGIEQVVIDTLTQLGLVAGRLADQPGVWVEPDGPRPRKIAAVGVKVTRGRSMHGLALNVDPDMAWFRRIVPCGIADKGVTSLAAEGIAATLPEVAEVLVASARARWSGGGEVDEQRVPWPADHHRPAESDASRSISAPGAGAPRGAPAFPTPPGAPAPGALAPARLAGATAPGALAPGAPPGARARLRLRQAGVDPTGAVPVSARKPLWLRVPAVMGDPYRALGRTVRHLGLVTVCEEAGCPNIFDCWAEGTATFMINGERCTRSCGFCLVDTRRPDPVDPGEPERVAAAVAELGLAHAVVTAVARDDLPDGGAAGFAATIGAIRRRCPGTTVEVLVPDCRGDDAALRVIFDARPDVLNHNLETVARLQRAVRPSAGYARSLAVLARAKRHGATTKSGLMVGLGERADELVGALADLRAVGVDIVTVGQYLRPSVRHLPVARWWTPAEFEEIAVLARAMGFRHVEASPLTRSSYHARRGAEAVRREEIADPEGSVPHGAPPGALTLHVGSTRP